MAAAFLDPLEKALRKHGIKLEGVLSDNGPEFIGKAFGTRAADLDLVHHRMPPRSLNHNSVCERFHGTVLREFYRPHFHRGRVDDIDLLDRSLQNWLCDYNNTAPTTAATWPDAPPWRSRRNSAARSARLQPDNHQTPSRDADLST